LFPSSDLLHQLVKDRQQDLLGSAAAGKHAQPSPVRRHIARSLRRAADRLDEATAAPGSMSGAHPGRG
jgi:hypothetical protein